MDNSSRPRFSLGLKTAVGIIVIALTLSGTAILFGYQTYKSALEEQLIHTAYNLAETIASQVDPLSIDRYLETGETDDAYWNTRQRLVDIQSHNDIKYAVVCKPTEKGFFYIFDTDQTDEAYLLGDFSAYYEGDFLDNKNNFLAGNPINPIISNYEFGWLLSAVVPIKDADGVMHAYVDVDLSMDEIIAMQHAFLFKLAASLFGLTFLLAVILLAATRRIIVRPVNRLARATAAFVSSEEMHMIENSSLDIPELNTTDEIGRLYCSIRQMEADIYDYIQNLTAVTAEKERIGAELDVAKSIQASMLPSIFPPFPNRSEFDIYATMNPAKEVGGDFYDFFLLDDDHLAMVMADVSGKGVPAALFMVIAKTLIKNTAQTGASVTETLERVNNQLCENNEAEMFVTVWLGILEISTGTLKAANAGHEYPVLRRAGGLFETVKDRHGFVLAGMENMHYKEYELTLHSGDSLFLYTDGVPEAMNTAGVLYGMQRMLDTLNRAQSSNCTALLHELKTDIGSFTAGAMQFDDITMLCLEMKG